MAAAGLELASDLTSSIPKATSRQKADVRPTDEIQEILARLGKVGNSQAHGR